MRVAERAASGSMRLILLRKPTKRQPFGHCQRGLVHPYGQYCHPGQFRMPDALRTGHHIHRCPNGPRFPRWHQIDFAGRCWPTNADCHLRQLCSKLARFENENQTGLGRKAESPPNGHLRQAPAAAPHRSRNSARPVKTPVLRPHTEFLVGHLLGRCYRSG